ncbi:hypothetical protein SmJEL517_g02588 [Synchytrium microbalum]|uniref:Cytochrome P450 n=1 Tax=Synchytrium microbalum TaxID=1806994 RepID=A0A507C6U7_9FUNG|nr:uncharacterized protein SmJEL517_g02588 [Synchytrium microbalum]TPX34849.1 hypothetical protein SmJEL517_g02588 [Synchytrium microbalum]
MSALTTLQTMPRDKLLLILASAAGLVSILSLIRSMMTKFANIKKLSTLKTPEKESFFFGSLGNLLDTKLGVERNSRPDFKTGGPIGNLAYTLGGSYVLWMWGKMMPFGSSMVVASDPQFIEELLSAKVMDDMVKGRSYDITADLIGKGILSNTGESWKHNRRLVELGFRLENLRFSAKRINTVLDRLITRWKSDATTFQNQEFDLRSEMLRTTMDVICQVGFGRDYESPEEAAKISSPNNESLWLVFQNILDDIALRARQRLIPWYQIWPNFGYAARMKCLNTAVSAMIDDRLAAIRDGSIKKDLEAKNNGTLLNAIVDLDESGKMIMSKKQMMDEIKTLLFAGHDTTGSAGSWAFQVIATNAEVRGKLLAEIKSYVGERRPSMEDVDRMPYLNAFLKEILRMYPSAGFTRKVVHDVTLNGHIIPAGVEIMVLPNIIQNDPKYFGSDANVFRPERFLDLDEVPRGYLPFSLGPRNCVGMKLAQLELRLVVVRLLQEFEFIYGDKPAPPVLLTMTLSPSEMQMRVKPIRA